MIDRHICKEVYEDLNVRYCAAIDEDDLEAWPSLFSAEGRYQINTRDNQRRQRPIGMFYCDSRRMMEDRVAAIRKVLTIDPHALRHLVGLPQIRNIEDNQFHGSVSFAVFRTLRRTEDLIAYATGSYQDRIELRDGQWVFLSRLVLLDSSKLETGVVIPI